MTQAMRREMLHCYIVPVMNLSDQVVGSDDALSIHLRGGDVFEENPHPDFIQPPLSFYQTLIQKRIDAGRPLSVRLVFEDLGNPCVDAIEAYCAANAIPCQLQSGRLEEDLAYLLGARHLVFGSGSFGVGGVLFVSSGPEGGCF